MSSSLNQPMAVERGRSHELVGSMVGAASSHVLESLIQVLVRQQQDDKGEKTFFSKEIISLAKHALKKCFESLQNGIRNDFQIN